MKSILPALLILLVGSALSAQVSPFTPLGALPKTAGEQRIGIEPDRAFFTAVRDAAKLAKVLQDAPFDASPTGGHLDIELISPSGEPMAFQVVRYHMITRQLQAALPSFSTLFGWDPSSPGRRIYLDWTATGFAATVVGGPEGRWLVEPVYAGQRDVYQSYYAADVPTRLAAEEVCGYEPDWDILKQVEEMGGQKMVGDCALREYRLALACTGEYFNAVGGSESLVVSEMMKAINRVNEVFRSELAITYKIINLPTEDGSIQLVYNSPNADPYTNNNGAVMLNENQNTIDDVIGFNNYDIGHVFSTGGGGIAQVNSPCSSGKARGVTGRPDPTGDPFYVDLVCHEMGHQCGATHSYNSTESNCVNRTVQSAYEPGSGTTIMAYAGICGPVANIQYQTDPYFHAISIQQVSNYVEMGGGNSCATQISTENNEPTTNAGNNYTIPANTPFVLMGTASDPDNDILTYCWEQFDLGQPVAGPPSGNETDAPLFRSFPPTPSPSRYFPRLSTLIDGAESKWEVLPKVSREMNFVLTTRESGGTNYGCTTQDQVTLNVIETGSPFSVTAPNGNENISANSNFTFTWDVAGTDANGINCSTVDITLSTDGGQTFTQDLGSFPNTGSAEITAPDLTSRSVRAMIKCADNVFFDVSDLDFAIERVDYLLDANDGSDLLCDGETTANYSFDLTSIRGYSGTINFSITQAPSGVTSNFSPTTVDLEVDGEQFVELQLGNLGNLAPGSYIFEMTADDGVNQKTLNLSLEVLSPIEAPNLLSPADGGYVDPDNSSFDWTDVENIDERNGYVLLIYSDAAGTQQAAGANITGSSANFGGGLSSLLTEGETYYWRVAAKNSQCNPNRQVYSSTWAFTYSAGQPSGSSLNPGQVNKSTCQGRQVEDYMLTFFEGDLSAPAQLAARNMPPGLSINFSEELVQDRESVDITVNGEENLSAGVYTFEVQATGENGETESINYSLEVSLNGIIVNSPTNDQQLIIEPDGSGHILVDFEPIAGASSYRVSITLPSGFANSINLGAQTSINIQIPAPVNEDDAYSITVVALNDNEEEIARSCDNSVVFRTALPVEWLHFTALPTEKTVELEWAVIQDTDHEQFLLERASSLATDWTDLAMIARSATNGHAVYTYVDNPRAVSSTYHYRIRQIDADGTTAHSNIQTVHFVGGHQPLQVFPNPVTDVLTIQAGFRSGGPAASYWLYDHRGRVVRSGKVISGQGRVDMANLPAAIYQIVVRKGENYVAAQRVVKR